MDTNDVETINSAALSRNPVEKLIINGNVKAMGGIWGMPNLTEFALGRNVESFEGCYSCPNLTSVKTNNKISQISTFRDNPLLKKMIIGSKISQIGPNCFTNSSGLEFLSIPSNIIQIGELDKTHKNETFSHCNSLKHIRFEDGKEPLKTGIYYFTNYKVEVYTPMFESAPIETVYLGRDIWYGRFGINDEDTDMCDYSLFSNRKSLHRLIVGEFVNIIPYRMFDNCTKLSEVISLSSSVTTSSSRRLSTYTKSKITLYVPNGTLNNFKAQYCWKNEDIKEYALYVVESTPLQTLNIEALADPEIINQAVKFESTNERVALMQNSASSVLEIISDGQSEILIRDSNNTLLAVVLIKSSSPQLGDSNANGHITVADAVNTANYALGNQTETFYYDAADVNGDRLITMSDASGAISILLDIPAISTASFAHPFSCSSAKESDRLILEDFSAKPGDIVPLRLWMVNAQDYVAMQADIKLPEGMELISIESTEGAINHSVITKQIDNNTLRVVLFDFNNNVFADNDAPILILNVKATGNIYSDIIINNALASDSEAKEYLLKSTGGHNSNMSGVTNVKCETINVLPEKGNISVLNAMGHEIAIYAIDGTVSARRTATSENENFNVIPGAYVVTVGDYTTKVVVK